MVSYQSPSSSSSDSASMSPLGMLEGIKLAKQSRDVFAPTYLGGDFNTPLMQALSKIALNKGEKATTQQMGKISSTPGLTAPAKQKMIANLSGEAIGAAAGVPGSMYEEAAKAIQQLITPISISQSSSQGGSGGGICSCENLKALNEGKLDENLRRFRDSHFIPLSSIDIGYKAMAEWMVPLVKKSPFWMKVGRALMLRPLCRATNWLYGEDKFGFIFLPSVYFWIWLWKIYGRMSKKRFTEKTPRPVLSRYPVMTITFLKRLGGIYG